MADIDFNTEEVTITKRTVDNDSIHIGIHMPAEKLSIDVTLKTHYSDDATTLQQRYLVLRNEEFTTAMGQLFPTTPWENPRAEFRAGIINILKANKDKLT